MTFRSRLLQAFGSDVLGETEGARFDTDHSGLVFLAGQLSTRVLVKLSIDVKFILGDRRRGTDKSLWGLRYLHLTLFSCKEANQGKLTSSLEEGGSSATI